MQHSKLAPPRDVHACRKPAASSVAYVRRLCDGEVWRGYSPARAEVAMRAAFATYRGERPTSAFAKDAALTPLGGHLTVSASSGVFFLSGQSDALSMLAFSGSNDVADARACADDTLVDGAAYGGGRVHRGASLQLDTVWPQIRAALLAALRRRPQRPLVITGHSFWGALATLAVARALREGLFDTNSSGLRPRIILQTFGQSQVGDADFARNFARQSTGITYIETVVGEDPIPSYPAPHLGYSRIPSALLVHHDMRGHTVVGLPWEQLPRPRVAWGSSLWSGARRLFQLLRRHNHSQGNYLSEAMATLANPARVVVWERPQLP